jgi:hypothetical protein
MLRRKLETGEKRSRAEDLQSWKYEAAVLVEFRVLLDVSEGSTKSHVQLPHQHQSASSSYPHISVIPQLFPVIVGALEHSQQNIVGRFMQRITTFRLPPGTPQF